MVASGYECLLSDLRALQDDTTVVSLDDRVVARTFYAYKRLPHVEPASVSIGEPPATDTDFAAANPVLLSAVSAHLRIRLLKFRSILKLAASRLAGSNTRGLGFQSCQR
jgi:hypothetical protein